MRSYSIRDISKKGFLFNHKPLNPLIIAAGSDNESKVQTLKCYAKQENQCIALPIYFCDSNFKTTGGEITEEKTEINVIINRKLYTAFENATKTFYSHTMNNTEQPFASGFRGGDLSLPEASPEVLDNHCSIRCNKFIFYVDE